MDISQLKHPAHLGIIQGKIICIIQMFWLHSSVALTKENIVKPELSLSEVIHDSLLTTYHFCSFSLLFRNCTLHIFTGVINYMLKLVSGQWPNYLTV